MSRKICFIGLGSIGKRHVKNLRILYGTDIVIHALRHGAISPIEGVDKQVMSVADLDDDYDSIFITNPTNMHLDMIKEVDNRGKAFFIEKPVRTLLHDESEEERTKYITEVKGIIGELGDKVYYVACPLRYTNVIKYVKENIDWKDVYSIRAISSSYLPEWRPDTDYSTGYSARRDLGGGVASDLIHEWDYVAHMIGMPNKVHRVERKLSNLKLNVEDIVAYIGEYDDKLVEVHLDYFGRMPIRRLELYCKEETVICDLINNTISYLRSGDVVRLDEDRDDYQREELKHFFDICDGKIKCDNDIRYAEELLERLE